MNQRSIKSIEGLRAIASLGILLCHFAGSFYPGFTGTWVWNSPLKIFLAGEPFVRIFFTLSGLVVTEKYLTKRCYEQAPKDAFNRYFRLLPMVVLACLFAYLLMKLGLTFNARAAEIAGTSDFLGIFNQFPANLGECLKEAFYGVFAGTGNQYVSPFWTIQYEFLGVLLVLAILCVFRENPLRYLCYAVILLFTANQYTYFVLGMVIAELNHCEKFRSLLAKNQIINTLLLIGVFCLFGAQDIFDDNKLWRIYYGILLAAFLLLLMTNRPADRILGSKAGCLLGKWSFGIYSFHWPVMISLMSYLYIVWENRTFLTMALIFVITVIATLLLAWGATVVSDLARKGIDKAENQLEYVWNKIRQ